MKHICESCGRQTEEISLICQACGMPLRSVLDRIAFAKEFQAFDAGESMLLKKILSQDVDHQEARDCLEKLYSKLKECRIRLSDAGIDPNELKEYCFTEKLIPGTVNAKNRNRRTISRGSTLPTGNAKATFFLKGRIKIHTDKYHIYFNNVGWYEVRPNCSWKVLDRILDLSRNKTEYQNKPFPFAFSRDDGLFLRKAFAVEKGPNGTWKRKIKQIDLATAVLDKNPIPNSGKKITTAQFKKIIYEDTSRRVDVKGLINA